MLLAHYLAFTFHSQFLFLPLNPLSRCLVVLPVLGYVLLKKGFFLVPLAFP